MSPKPEVNNDFYHTLGERWYTATDDPVALLRAEGRIKEAWILDRISGSQSPEATQVLDVACGAGFLANALSKKGFAVTGIDQSEDSLRVAHLKDETQKVNYQTADAYQLPFENASFDVVTCMDFLEHVNQPEKIIQEISRVLKPGGKFFYHTFSRNLWSWLLVIKCLDWFVKNTPPHLHVYHLFLDPEEVQTFCEKAGLRLIELTGIRPKLFSWAIVKLFFTGEISSRFEFQLTNSKKVSYLGCAVKTS